MPHGPAAHGTHLGRRAEGSPVAARTIGTGLLPSQQFSEEEFPTGVREAG